VAEGFGDKTSAAGKIMNKNLKITIEYDGTKYCGWQRQKDKPTIQGEIEKALLTMTGKRITLTGAGRTDAGVHAFGQVANFQCERDWAPEVFQKGLNGLLPNDIVIKECHQVDDSFHARYDVRSKIYHYRILNRPVPAAIGRHYAWFIPRSLDLSAMRSAIASILGSQDFKAFEGSGSPRTHTIRHVMAAELDKAENGHIIFNIEANGFLRFMVRNIVGTLVAVGLGAITPDDFREIRNSKDRRNAGMTAPAQGLFLMQVKY
jgi:tRNA pseudouridine38-40 synthase